MKIQHIAIATAAILGICLGAAQISAGDDKKETEKRMIDEARKAAEKPQDYTNYDVKKSHDEHIPATEKAAADATKKDKPNK
jgi:hypothetical protein